MSRFADAWSSRQHLLEDAFGETFLVLPQSTAADVNAPAVSDPLRLSFSFIGIFDEMPKVVEPLGRNKSLNSTDYVTGAQPKVDAAKTALLYLPATGDELMRVATAERFRVSEAVPADLDRIELKLTRLKSA